MHGTLSCPVCGTTGIALGSSACPSCHVAFASPIVAPAFTPPAAAATATAPATASAPADTWAPRVYTPAASTPPAPAAEAVTYASIGRRFVAGVIDMVIVATPFLIVQGGAYFDPYTSDGFFANDPMAYLEMVVFLFYVAAFQSSSKQATPGMQVMDMRLVREDDLGPVSFARAAGRDVATWLSGILLMVGYLMIAFTAKRQALHDKLASTVVVHDRH